MINRIGTRGPAPKPTNLKKKYGINLNISNEPQPQSVAPEKPMYLDDRASAEWDKIVPMLLELGLLTKIDGTTLANWCILHSQMQQAANILKRSQILVKGEKGNLVKNPAFYVLCECVDRLNRLAHEFGMTPSSRTRITLEVSQTNKDPNADIFATMPSEIPDAPPALPDGQVETTEEATAEEIELEVDKD